MGQFAGLILNLKIVLFLGLVHLEVKHSLLPWTERASDSRPVL